MDPRPATAADLPAIREVVGAAYAIYTHLGYREVGRHTEDGYRRVFMEKLLVARA